MTDFLNRAQNRPFSGSAPGCRVAVIGNAGAGKSTLSRRMGEILGVPIYSLDEIIRRKPPNWELPRSEQYVQQLDELLRQDNWIIDGFGTWDFIEKEFLRCHGNYLPLFRHYLWVAKREFFKFFTRGLGLRVSYRLWVTTCKTMWSTHQFARPILVKELEKARDHADVVWLRSSSEIARFLYSLENLDV